MIPDSSSKHVGQTVNLICNNPEEDGNPDCHIYTWNRIEGSDGIPLPTSKILTFKMEESRAGNYTCTCGNDYNTSFVSNMAEVIFKTGPAPTPTPTAASCRFSFIYFLDNTNFLFLLKWKCCMSATCRLFKKCLNVYMAGRSRSDYDWDRDFLR